MVDSYVPSTACPSQVIPGATGELCPDVAPQLDGIRTALRGRGARWSGLNAVAYNQISPLEYIAPAQRANLSISSFVGCLAPAPLTVNHLIIL